ncbi:MAG: FAD-dependent oxidoreductase [Candidatus Pacebacteria bacterium]|nr:FAD-dependent oxidoreductase [Candidatus Paceibacterota bacterium]
MKVAIIGAGFVGLSAAWKLQKKGRQVIVFEASDLPGGLAGGFKQSGWDWPLEYYYHHIFSKDQAILDWLGELGLTDQVFFKETKTVSLYQGDISPLDSPFALLTYSQLSWLAKLKTAFGLAFLKLLPRGKFLEKWTAKQFLLAWMGAESWRVLWQPLFEKKFGQYANRVNMAWFWARIKARTKKLGYFEQGFGGLAQKIVDRLTAIGVEFRFGEQVEKIAGLKQQGFDQILFTGTSQQLLELADWPTGFKQSVQKLKLLAAQTLILEMEQPFFADGTYWLNVNQLDWPILGVVDQTNFVDPENYGGSHLVYVGNYLTEIDPQWELDKQELLDFYQPYLDQLSPGFKQWVKEVFVFRSKAAQPVVLPNHSQLLPGIKTPDPSVFWAGMEQIYPYDRGVNYAVELGLKTAARMIENG